MADPLQLLRQPKAAYGAEYDKHLFEQYKLYVEMADRISARRMLANSFFVGIHTALITAFTVLLKEKVLLPTPDGLALVAAVLLLCFIWWWVIRSYRQLNTAKFKVVHALEQLLPAAPYDAEWNALGRGESPRLYLPLTHAENAVPLCFGLLYVLLAFTLYVK
jgi:hypothetical protein